jgi:hypothetical protein
MTGPGVSDHDMPSFRRSGRRDESALTDESLAALLSGTQDPPPELRPALDVLAALQAGPARDELADEAAALAEFRISATRPRPAHHPRRRRPGLLSSLSGRVVTATAVAVVVIGGVMAAAMTDVLPAPLQRLAHEDFGVRLPSTHRSKHKARSAATSVRDSHDAVTRRPRRHGGSDPVRHWRHDRCAPISLPSPSVTAARWHHVWESHPCVGWRWRSRWRRLLRHHHWPGLHRHFGQLPTHQSGHHHMREPMPSPGHQPSPRPSSQAAPQHSSHPSRRHSVSRT